MPNGHDRNLMRVYEVLDGFYARHGHWPSTLRMPRISLDDLFSNVLSAEGVGVLQTRVRTVPDDEVFCAEDDAGNAYQYLSDLDETVEVADGAPTRVRAEEWLGLGRHIRHMDT